MAFSHVSKRSLHIGRRLQRNVAVVGAAGGIGQPLSLLAKLSPLTSRLHLYDVAPVTPGVAADISHINTRADVKGFAGTDFNVLKEAITGSDVILVPAGVPRKPGMTRDDLFSVNAGIVANVAKAAAQVAPKAMLLIISNPVNSTVPVAAEVQKRVGAYDKNRVFGVSTLDVLRANTFVAEHLKIDVSKLNVPVIGGHAGITILPLLSQVKGAQFSKQDVEALTQRVAFGGDEVVKAKAGAGSATLSMAFAGWAFADQVIRALNGEKGIIACTFVENGTTPTPWFASQVELGTNGISRILPLPELSDFEKEKLKAALPELEKSIKNGVEFAAKYQL